MEKDGHRIAVKANVLLKAVQEIVCAKIYYKANEAWVVTNSNYTKAVEKLAESNDVELVGRTQQIAFSLEVKKAQESRSE